MQAAGPPLPRREEGPGGPDLSGPETSRRKSLSLRLVRPVEEAQERARMLVLQLLFHPLPFAHPFLPSPWPAAGQAAIWNPTASWGLSNKWES